MRSNDVTANGLADVVGLPRCPLNATRTLRMIGMIGSGRAINKAIMRRWGNKRGYNEVTTSVQLANTLHVNKDFI